jgi:ribosome assembly protein YihI (activator of Der GTPase)
MDGRSTSSHDNKEFRTSSREKQRGMAFGFQKTATDNNNNNNIKKLKPPRIDR